MNTKELIATAKTAAIAGGIEIMKIYETEDFNVEMKSDNSPLTKADKAAHYAIIDALQDTNLPVLSEEGKLTPYSERKDWERFWMIDPLDGTKEFIKKNGQFTVNIALIEGEYPIGGVIYVPATKRLYWSVKGEGAFTQGEEQNEILLSAPEYKDSDTGLKIVASASHFSQETKDFIEQFDTPELTSKGSSLKFMIIADGDAHVYPRIAPTMEWDTAAAQAILEEAGGTVTRYDSGIRMHYNKEDLLNPYFVATGKRIG